jgi:hypothetical protein
MGSSVVVNMSSVSKGVFKSNVQNYLGEQKKRAPLPNIAKRYIYTRILRGIQGKGDIIIIAITGLGRGVYSDYRNYKRNKEIQASIIETNKVSQELVKSYEKFSNQQFEHTLELRRANKLKEMELELLKLKEKQVKAPSLMEEHDLFAILIFLEGLLSIILKVTT